MVQLITGIGVDFPDGVAVHDLVRVMLKDNWDSIPTTPDSTKIRFTDVGWIGNYNYQISTVQLPYILLRSSGSGAYQHIRADVEINVWQRRLTNRKPAAITTMMNRISEIIGTNKKHLDTGIVDTTLANIASGMDHIVLTDQFKQPGQRTIQLTIDRPTETNVWHTQALASVFFFRYIT